MNKLFLFLFIAFNSSIVLAQKTDSVVNKSAKARNVDGSLMSPSKTIQVNISASPGFSTLASIIKADTTNIFNGDNPITIFAPDNKAFGKLPAGTIDSLLLPTHKTDLINLLKYHAIAGKITSKDIERQIKAGNGQATFTSLSGRTLMAKINENRNIVLTDENGGQSIVSRLNVEQGNGILYVVTQVLMPKMTQQLQENSKPQ
ncbi:fasciclin domain-containing protein [Mucilaginibacter sp. BT774]|uniref:fasciclin domain-containing protein n=1 Tax=Mucilaginibacter sp. BT774 TaxID=3062276 RepID=UPI002675951C|nr:fasciclin domain-containing protein [Mucilaginibacter sp. BT774]MDO3628766.1 fasciclin domain-containing protein [Mucilaginibacter sp. BT774]